MRTSQSVSIRPVLEQAIDSINAFFALEKQSQKIAAEFDLKYKLLLSTPEATASATKLETLTQNQLMHDVTAKLGPPPRNYPGINYEEAIENYRARAEALLRQPVTHPRIENFYPWRHSAELAAESLGKGGWAMEAGAILNALQELPKQSVPNVWEEPGAIDKLRDSVRSVANRVLEILIAANRELEILIAGDESEESGDEQPRRGRLPKAESKLLKTLFLAKLREHQSLIDDPATLAGIVGISESTCRRWTEEFREQYIAFSKGSADPDE